MLTVLRGTVCVDCSCTEYSAPHKVQSARLFLPTSELGPPILLPPGECVPSPLWFRGGDTLACGRGGGGGGSQFGRGDRLVHGALGTVYLYFVVHPLCHMHIDRFTFTYNLPPSNVRQLVNKTQPYCIRLIVVTS